MRSSQVVIKDPFAYEKRTGRKGTLWTPSQRPTGGALHQPLSLCPPLTLHRATQSQPVSDRLDLSFLRVSSCMEHVNGELQYRCSSCLWFFPTLALLHTHITLGWKEGFSCRVYYRKLREIRWGPDTPSRLQGRGLQSATRHSSTKHSHRLFEERRRQGGGQEQSSISSLQETERKNAEIMKWLAEIQDPVIHCHRP